MRVVSRTFQQSAFRSLQPALILPLLLAAFLCLAGAAAASCGGRDLLAELSPAARLALERQTGKIPHARGNMWQASRQGRTLYLVGTYHVADMRHAAMRQALQSRLDTVDMLLVEATPIESARLTLQLAANPEILTMPGGESLRDHLSPAEWRHLKDQLAGPALPVQQLARMRPWYLATRVGAPACMMVQNGQTTGLDHMLITDADNRGLPVLALEPHDTLLRAARLLTLDEEIGLLRGALRTLDDTQDMAVTLANAYFRGEARLYWNFARGRGDDPVVHRQYDLLEKMLLTGRNKAWIPVIEQASTRGTPLVAFGALHLAGHAGVLALLERRGWTITPLDP